MRKYMTLILTILVVLLSGCVQNNTGSDYISDGKLEYLHRNYQGYPEGFGFENAVGKYERIVNSASSLEEATLMLEEKFTNGTYCTYKIELVEETEYYYAIYVEWGAKDKNGSSWNEIVVSFKKDIYDYQKNIIKTTDKNIIKKIVDYIHYAKIYNIAGYSILDTNILELEDHYRHETYLITTCYGDWDVHDQVNYEKYVTIVDKQSGLVKVETEEIIKTIFVAGSGINAGSVNEEGVIEYPYVFDVTDYVPTEDLGDLNFSVIDLKTMEEKYNYYLPNSYWKDIYVGILFLYSEEKDNKYDYQYPIYRNLLVTNNNLKMTRIIYANPSYSEQNKKVFEIQHVELILVPKDWKYLNEIDGAILSHEYVKDLK